MCDRAMRQAISEKLKTLEQSAAEAELDHLMKIVYRHGGYTDLIEALEEFRADFPECHYRVEETKDVVEMDNFVVKREPLKRKGPDLLRGYFFEGLVHVSMEERLRCADKAGYQELVRAKMQRLWDAAMEAWRDEREAGDRVSDIGEGE